MDIFLIGFLIFVYIGLAAMTYLIIDVDNPILKCFATLLWPLFILWSVIYIGLINPIADVVEYVKEKKGENHAKR